MSKVSLESSMTFCLGSGELKEYFVSVCKKFSLSDEISIKIYSCCSSLFETNSYYKEGVIEFVLALYLVGGKERVIEGEEHEVFFIKFLKRYSFCFDFDQGYLNPENVDKIKDMLSKDLVYIEENYCEFLKYIFDEIIVLSKISERLYGDQIMMCFQEFWRLRKLYILFGDCTGINDAMLKSIFKFIKTNEKLIIPGGLEVLFSICLKNVDLFLSREFVRPFSAYFFKKSKCLPDGLKEKIEAFEGKSLEFIDKQLTEIIHDIEDFLIENFRNEPILISNIKNRIVERVDILLDGTPDTYKTEPNRGRIIKILKKYEDNFVPGGIEALLASFVFEQNNDFDRFEGFFLKNLKYFSKGRFYLMRISEKNISELHRKSFSYIRDMYDGFLVDIFSKISRIECYYKFASTHKDDYKEEDFDFVCILFDLKVLCGDLSFDELKSIFNFMVERKREVARYGFDVVFALVIWKFKEREKFNVDVFMSRCDEIFPYFYKENFGLLRISECELCTIRSECIFNIFANFKAKKEFCTLFKKIDEGIKSIFFANEKNGIESLGYGYFLFFDIIDFFEVNEKCDRLRISEILKYYPCNLEYFKASFTILCIHLGMKILGEEFLKYFGRVLEYFVESFPYFTDGEKHKFKSLSFETFEIISLSHTEFLVEICGKARRIFDFLNIEKLEFDEKLVPMIVEVFDLYKCIDAQQCMEVFKSANENIKSINVDVKIIFFLALESEYFCDFVYIFRIYISFFSRNLIYLKFLGNNQIEQLRNKTFEELRIIDKNVVNDIISETRNVEVNISFLKRYDTFKSCESLAINVCWLLDDFSFRYFFGLLVFLCEKKEPISKGDDETFIGMAISKGKCKNLESVFLYCQKIMSFFDKNKLFLEKFKRIDVSELCGKNLTEILESTSVIEYVQENLFVFFGEENFFNNDLLSRLCVLVADKYDVDSICLRSFVELREKCEVSIFLGSVEAIVHFIFVLDKCLDFKNFIFLFGTYFNYFRSEDSFLCNDDESFLSNLEGKANVDIEFLDKIREIHHRINMIRIIEGCIGGNFRFSEGHTEFLLVLSNKFNEEKLKAISSLIRQRECSFFTGAIGLLFVCLAENNDVRSFLKIFDFYDETLDIFKKESSFFSNDQKCVIQKAYESEFVDWDKLYTLLKVFVSLVGKYFYEILEDFASCNEDIYSEISKAIKAPEYEETNRRRGNEEENGERANKKHFSTVLYQADANAECSKFSTVDKSVTSSGQTRNHKIIKKSTTIVSAPCDKRIVDVKSDKSSPASNSAVSAEQKSVTKNDSVVSNKQVANAECSKFSTVNKSVASSGRTRNHKIIKNSPTAPLVLCVKQSSTATQIARNKSICFSEKEIEILRLKFKRREKIMLEFDEFFFKDGRYKSHWCQVRVFFALFISNKDDSNYVSYLMKYRGDFVKIFSEEMDFFSAKLRKIVENADKTDFSDILFAFHCDKDLLLHASMLLNQREISSFNPNIIQYLCCNCFIRISVFYDIFIHYKYFMEKYLISLLKFFSIGNQNFGAPELDSNYEKFLLVFAIVLYEKSKEKSKFELLDAFIEKPLKAIIEFCSSNLELIGKMSNLPLQTCVFKYSESLIALSESLHNEKHTGSLSTEKESCREESCQEKSCQEKSCQGELVAFDKRDEENTQYFAPQLTN